MVYKIIKHKYGIFIESFILALVIFLIGFSIGFYFENLRNQKVIDNYRDNEIQALDLKLQNYYYQTMNSNQCGFAIQQNFIFADRLYNEGLQLEQFEEANQISESIKVEKKKYVLLKTELWLNSLLLKEKCDKPFDTIVYFYIDDSSNQVIVSEQQIISNVLKEIKEEKGNKVILLPIAGDLGLDIVNLQKESYNITSLPIILINEKYVLEGYHTKEDIKKYL